MDSILGFDSETAIQQKKTMPDITDINTYPISANQWTADDDQSELDRNVVSIIR